MKNKRRNNKKNPGQDILTPQTRLPLDDPIAAPVTETERRQKVKLDELTATNRHLKRKIFDLYTIFEISRNFNAVLDYHSLLDSFIFTCLGQVGALKASIFLNKDGDTERFYLAKSKGSGELPLEDQYFAADSKLGRYLTKLNRPALIPELLDDIATAGEQEILRNFESGIIVPLIYQTRLSGIFAMAEKISGREFGIDDVEFLSILGNQIAVAIENARLYEGEKKATRQLRSAQQQLLQSERLAALGEMAAKIAHEVNNPLGIIKNYIQLLKQPPEGDGQSLEYVEIVGQEIDRIADIVKQLLEFCRPQSQAVAPVDVVGVVDDILVLMERQLSSNNVRLKRDFRCRKSLVTGSPENLRQVFLNLIINAQDAMKDGGELTVMVSEKAETVTIGFCDTGPGIAPEVIQHIFEPFFTTKESGSGTGLGLSVCYGIVKRHKGSITFKNSGSGGCFEVELPLAATKGQVGHFD